MGMQLRTTLSRLQPAFTGVDQQVSTVLNSLLTEKQYPFIKRQKTEDSILQKIETGRYAKFSEIDDLIAFSVIIPNLAHEHIVLARLASAFDIIETRTRTTAQRDPANFAFDSTRVYCRLKLSDPDSYDPFLSKLTFEIQIRTAFEHAWAVAVHDEVYKSQDLDLRKMRFAAEIKAQIEMLDRLLSKFENGYSEILVPKWNYFDSQIKVIQFVNAELSSEVVPPELLPADLRRFSENFVSLVQSSAKKADEIDEVLAKLKDLISAKGRAAFPLSLTTLQSCIVLLYEIGCLKPRDRTFLHITDEVTTFCPPLASTAKRFDYDWVAGP